MNIKFGYNIMHDKIYIVPSSMDMTNIGERHVNLLVDF